MMIPPLEIVLNVEYGGFSFDTEMALYLQELGWAVIKAKDYDYKAKYPVNTLIDCGNDYFTHPDLTSIELRTHPDLIKCVKDLQKLHENDEYLESHYGHIPHNFKVQSLQLEIEIQNYDDGIERVKSYLREV